MAAEKSQVKVVTRDVNFGTSMHNRACCDNSSSNYLSVLLKLLKRIVAQQLIGYSKSLKLLSRLQSAYIAH